MDGPLRSGSPGKLTQLVVYLEVYGDELEADFQQTYSLDLGKLWRSGEHARALRLIHQLPQASRFNGAVANNPEHVEQIVKATGGQQTAYHPPLSEWHIENDQLASIKESIDTLVGVQIARGGGKPGKVRPMPRPRTEFASARERVKLSEHKKLVARVLKKPSPPPVD